MRKERAKILPLLLAILLLSIGNGASAGYRPPITEAVIFPDGFAFLVRQGETALENGECVLDLLPPALNGSLEVYSTDPGLVLEEVVAYQEERTADRPVSSLAELFRANTGKAVELVVNGKKVNGVVKSFLEPHHLVVTTTGDKGSGKDELYPIATIDAYSFPEPVTLTLPETSAEGRLNVRFREAGSGRATYPVGISYLQAGLSWSPEYMINIDASEQSGIFTFSGVIRNEADDLVNTTVYLAEKGPQFISGLSPLVVFATDQGYAARGAELTAMGVRSDKLAFAPGVEREEAASRAMYKMYNMYRRNDVTLKIGERALLPLDQSGVRVEPLYRVRLSRLSVGSGQIVAEPVWKVYRIYNNSPFPWIEGRVMLKMAEQPLGIGDFPYIARNQSGEIEVMMEPAVRVEASEEEFERVQGGIDFRDREYASVRVRGEIKIDNTKDDQITLKVTHEVPGEVVAVGEGGTVVKKAVLQAGPNPTSELNWEIALRPRSQYKLTYTYQTYLPIKNY